MRHLGIVAVLAAGIASCGGAPSSIGLGGPQDAGFDGTLIGLGGPQDAGLDGTLGTSGQDAATADGPTEAPSSAEAGDTGAAPEAGDDSGMSMVECDSGSNLGCRPMACPDGGTASLHGTVYDPAGQNPLYGVTVYVPGSAPGALPAGASCASCASWYTDPVVAAITDTAGNFTLEGVPVGAQVPFVVQIGKWRMQYKLSNVAPCSNNDAAELAGTTLRLPKNHTEGDIPNIAVSTGAADSLECLLYRMGVDKSEYTGDPNGAGRIHVFTGGDAVGGRGGAVTNPPSKLSYQHLWNSDGSMTPYDLVLLGCEGAETSGLDDAGRTVLWDYVRSGGRVLATHFHYAWFTPTGPFASVSPALASWQTGVGGVGDVTAPQNVDVVTTRPNGGPFPEGVAFKQWLQNSHALTNGELPIYYAHDNASVTAANTHSQAWLELDASSPAPNAAQYFSFDTPIDAGPAAQCGRAAYSSLHVSGGASSQADAAVPVDYPGFSGSGGIVPDGCASHALTPQEKALEFVILDLSSCLTPIGQLPAAP